jgi:hypothetical protein
MINKINKERRRSMNATPYDPATRPILKYEQYTIYIIAQITPNSDLQNYP